VSIIQGNRGAKCFRHSGRHTPLIVEEHNTGLDSRDFAIIFAIRKQIEQITTTPSSWSRSDLNPNYLTIEGLGPVNDRSVSHDNATPADIGLGQIVSGQKLKTGLVSKRQDSIVPKVSAIVNIPDTYRNLTFETEPCGQINRFTVHG
jgi:hypothetical protein